MDDHVIFFKSIDEALLLIPPITSIFKDHGMDIGAKKTNIMLRHNAHNLSKLYEYDVIDEYKYLGTPISYDLLRVAEREFLDFSKKRANWKGLAIHGMVAEENTFFRMYVTSKIRHRVIPYLLGVLGEGPQKVN
jgi:hypothetical protein